MISPRQDGTIRFADSRSEPGLQTADLAVYLHRRSDDVAQCTPRSQPPSVTVVNGTVAGGGVEFVAGAEVTVTADAPELGLVFDRWTGAGLTLTGSEGASLTFTMPAQAVSLTATYQAQGQSHPLWDLRTDDVESPWSSRGGQMTVSLTGQQEDYVNALVAQGDYPNAAAVVEDGLALVEARRRDYYERLLALRSRLQVAWDQNERGDYAAVGRDEIDAYVSRLGRLADAEFTSQHSIGTPGQ